MRYLMADRNTIIDRRDFSFKSIRHYWLDLEVPPYFWDFKESTEHEESGQRYVYTDEIVLNHFVITFEGTTMLCLEFDNKISKEPVVLRIVLDSHAVGDTLSRYDKSFLQATTVTCVVSNSKDDGGRTIQAPCVYDMPVGRKANFERVAGLAHKGGKNGGDMLSFGITPVPMQFWYKNRPLNGKSYVLLYGAIGVLLGDDMTFDALVLIKNLRQSEVGIENIIYTTNPYLMKAKLVLG